MNKLRQWIFFSLVLTGFLGFLGWSGYIYYDVYQNRQSRLEQELVTFKTLLNLIPQSGELIDLVEPIARNLMAEKPNIRFISFGQNEKIHLFLARSGITVPSDLDRRNFPGFTPIPYFHHYLNFLFIHESSFHSVAIWIDPVWTWQDLEAWFWPAILLAGVLFFGIVFLIISIVDLHRQNKLHSSNASLMPSDREEEKSPPIQQTPADEDSPVSHKKPPENPKKAQSPKVLPSSINLYDEGGLVWPQFFVARLETELNRSTADNQDLCLVFAVIEGPGGWEPTLLELIQTFLPYRDLVFRYEKGIALIQPKVSLEKLFDFLKKFSRDFCSVRKANKIKIGLSARSGRIISPKMLMDEALSALSKAGYQHDQIVGFKADPELYRNYLNSLG